MGEVYNEMLDIKMDIVSDSIDKTPNQHQIDKINYLATQGCATFQKYAIR